MVPEWTEVRAWAQKNAAKTNSSSSSTSSSISAESSPESLLNEPSVIALLTSEIEGASALLKSFERPSRFDIILEPFNQENQMLTPKMSIRRPVVLRTYQSKLDAMYAGTGGYALRVKRSEHDE